MKKQLLLLVMILLPLVASANPVEIDGIYYNLITKGGNFAAEVTNISDGYYTGNVVLPESITYENNEYCVTRIGDVAFRKCTDLISITIPNSVTSIGEAAFQWCTGLTSITIPNSVTSIGSGAFQLCKGLISITIPNGLTSIGDATFSECYSLTNITIPNSVTNIGDGAFSSCI